MHGLTETSLIARKKIDRTNVIKLFVKELEIIGNINIGSDDFDIEKFAMLIMKSGKLYMIKGIKILIQGKIKTFGTKKT